MRKPDFFTRFLGGLALAGTLIASALCVYYLQTSRQLQRAHYTRAAIQQKRAIFQAFANDTAEFARANPSLIPLMQGAGVTIVTNASPRK
ncbi:MAG: hypothetical protein SFY81_14670 [Verrucomicrobiota bacterium]|nr:hypothetical protein [Verrucomicrobiota bacterium]